MSVIRGPVPWNDTGKVVHYKAHTTASGVLREVASGNVFRVGGSLAARVWDFNETYVNET